MPLEYFGGDQATVNDCADATAIFMSSGGPGAKTIQHVVKRRIILFFF